MHWNLWHQVSKPYHYHSNFCLLPSTYSLMIIYWVAVARIFVFLDSCIDSNKQTKTNCQDCPRTTAKHS